MFIDYLINILMRVVQNVRSIDNSFSIYNCFDENFSNSKENILYFIPSILTQEDYKLVK
jgi:hypothetical protein